MFSNDQAITMSLLPSILFTNIHNELYQKVCQFYYEYWSTPDNIASIMDLKITSCNLCSYFDTQAIAVLGLYYDSLPFTSVSLLDSAVVTIMCLLKEDELNVDNPRFLECVRQLNPDVIRNHYFINFCNTQEKTVNDWDVTEMLRSLMSSLKTGTACIRQFANLTKLLKKECKGECNTFKTKHQIDALEKVLKSEPEFYISDRHRLRLEAHENNDNTAERFKIACMELGIELL